MYKVWGKESNYLVHHAGEWLFGIPVDSSWAPLSAQTTAAWHI